MSMLSPETVEGIRKHFFDQFTKANSEVICTVAHLNMATVHRDRQAIETLLGEMEEQIQAMRKTWTVFEFVLED